MAVNDLSVWFSDWGLTINCKKSAVLVLSKQSSRLQIPLFLEGEAIPQVESYKHLPEKPVFREIHLSSVGLEQANATQAPSFIDET